ncbi:MAG: hypothetical protein ACRC8S_07165 [Fimbriiglobus sp.]
MMDTTTTPARRPWKMIVGLVLIIAWLWGWTIIGYAFDFPRQKYTNDRLAIPTNQILLFFGSSSLYIFAIASHIVALTLAFRRLRVIGSMLLVVVPAVMLMVLYFNMGLRPAVINQLTAAAAAAAAAPPPAAAPPVPVGNP